MNVQQLSKSKRYRKAARTLLCEVNKLIDEAGKSIDHAVRRELYLQAMGISNQAYSLLGKARKLAPAKTLVTKGQVGRAKKLYHSDDN